MGSGEKISVIPGYDMETLEMALKAARAGIKDAAGADQICSVLDVNRSELSKLISLNLIVVTKVKSVLHMNVRDIMQARELIAEKRLRGGSWESFQNHLTKRQADEIKSNYR